MNSDSLHKEYEKLIQDRLSFSELKEKYPESWNWVVADIYKKSAGGGAKEIVITAESFKKNFNYWIEKVHQSGGNKTVLEASLPELAKVRLFQKAWKSMSLSALTEGRTGKVRLNLWNGLILQKLFFKEKLVRKPVSLFWFRILWPFVTQKKIVMALLYPKGIYCLYSKALIRKLAGLLKGQEVLEIGAGDGSLASFLKEAGINITATDDYSWSGALKYPESVEKLSAQEALKKYQPGTVICSWPPAGNSFEKSVFETPSVKTYIVLLSRHQFASGNWDTYEAQKKFQMQEAKNLSGLILPPEIQPMVLIFTRK